ncbi:MAG TPA: hypothetical protein VF789_34535 [Thermoanaerobaculia bacterium]
MSKQSALADLMVKLSMDPELRRRFQENPSSFLEEMELSEEELSLLAGGNPGQIRDYLGGDAPSECFVMFSTEE